MGHDLVIAAHPARREDRSNRRFVGHYTEMAASMLIPTFAVMAVLVTGVAKSDTLMVPEHVGMLACMLGAMLLRRDEYSLGLSWARPDSARRRLTQDQARTQPRARSTGP